MQFHSSVADVLKSEMKLKMVKFLLNHEASMSEREIASVLKISHMSVNRTMQELAAMNFVQYSRVGKAHLWRVNRNSYAHGSLKQLVEALKIVSDPVAELKKIILSCLPVSLVKKIILFGSIAQNKGKPNSDIDLFILVKNANDQKKIEESIEQLSTQCLEVFGNRLSPYILTEGQLKQKKNLKIIVEINQGIVIYPKGRTYDA